MAVDFFCPHCGAVNPSRNIACAVCTYAFTPASPASIKSHTLLKQRYQIMDKLGQGGFAAVYKAQDLQFLRAFRAIKEMHDAHLNPQEKQEAVTAFQQEAQILARLIHPNLPRIYDYFEERQRWYLIMDYLDGETLDKVLARTPKGKLSVEKVISYALQLCKVLNYLHTQVPPIIFRDLKPSNILITHDDHLYLIDFGIARIFKPGKAQDTMALGSPGYAAPEQYGKEQTTTLADIYSFGATLHHLLSGLDPRNQPFIFPPLQLEPPHPLTQALADLVARMVAIKKDERPANVLEIQQALFAIALQQAIGIERGQAHAQEEQAQTVVSPSLQIDNTPPAKLLGKTRPHGSQKWFFPSGDEVVSSPTVVDGVVYFGSHDYKLYAVDASYGQKIWSFATGSRVKSSPTVVNGIVYFGSNDHNLYAVYASSSKKKWSFPTNGEIRSSPTVVNGIVYFGSNDHNLYAVHASSGQRKWSFPTGGWVRSSPTVVNGTVYFGSYDRKLYALDAASGQKKWSFPTGGWVYSSPAVTNDRVYFGSDDRTLYALDTSSGQQKWSFSGPVKWSFLTDNGVRSSPIVVDGIVYFGSDDHCLHALDAVSGQEKWSFLTGGWVHSSPTVVNDTVYFGSDDYNLYALDAVSGQQKWSFLTGYRVKSSPTVVNGIVYIGSGDGNLYAIFA